jgi:hypothetical protein
LPHQAIEQSPQPDRKKRQRGLFIFFSSITDMGILHEHIGKSAQTYFDRG